MNIFFDTLITLLLVITAFPAVILLYSSFKRKQSWEYVHHVTSGLISFFLLCCFLLIIWGSFLEPRLLVVNRQTIDIPAVQEPFTVVFIADFQVGPYKRTQWVEKVVQKILELKPDMVFIGGDNVDNGFYAPDEVTYLAPLKKLAEQIPTYAIHGNHEYGIGDARAIMKQKGRGADMTQETKTALEKIGITYLVNNVTTTTIRDQTICLFGGDEYWAHKLNFSELNKCDESIPTIALIHNPSFIFSPYPQTLDLVLSGHTHGGQIRLPFVGPLARVDDVLPRAYYKGLHTINDSGSQLFVTSGIGETGTRARLFNPPEIALITIK